MFDRRKRKGWQLAASLACPFCYNRVWGDKEYIWCMTYDCMFYIPWENSIELYNHHPNQMFTEDFKGTLHLIGGTRNQYKIIEERHNRFYKRKN